MQSRAALMQLMNQCPSINSIFWPMTAFSHFYNPQRRHATPAVVKMLRPRRVEDPELFIGEPKSTISGWTQAQILDASVYCIRQL